jgi:hypothetical protein
MKKEAFALAVAALAVAGCGRTPFPVLETQLSGLNGQSAQEVVKKLGEPDQTSEISGEKVYVWSSGPFADAAGEIVGLHCTVKVFADRDDKIVRHDFDGNVGGCGYYAHRLDKSYRLVNWPAK